MAVVGDSDGVEVTSRGLREGDGWFYGGLALKDGSCGARVGWGELDDVMAVGLFFCLVPFLIYISSCLTPRIIPIGS